MSNRFTFDKFMDRFTEDDESRRREISDYGKGNTESPARKLNQLYRELWQNRIRWRK